MVTHQDVPKILRYSDLRVLFKVSRSSLDRWEQKNQFPKRIVLGENSVGWRADEVRQWIEERAKGELNEK